MRIQFLPAVLAMTLAVTALAPAAAQNAAKKKSPEAAAEVDPVQKAHEKAAQDRKTERKAVRPAEKKPGKVEMPEEAKPGASAGQGAKSEPYPLDTCIVSGKKLGSMGDPVILRHKGREVRFCCEPCVEKFKAEPETYLADLDKKIVADQKAWYPLNTCIVTGEKLGGMGDPVDYVYRNRLVRLCCAGCIEKFEQGAPKYLETLDKAVIEKQKDSYPFKACMVMGEPLEEGSTIDFVLGNRLYRLCCKSCVKTVGKDPTKYSSQLDQVKARGGS